MKTFVYLLLFVISFSKCEDAIFSGIVNSKVERTIDLASQLVKINTKITVENTGKTPVIYFLFTIEPEIRNHLAFIGAVVSDESRTPLTITETKVAQHPDKHFWRVTLRKPLDPSKDIAVEVESVFSHALAPYPSHISQSEKQLVNYHGNHYLLTPYLSRKQTTTIQLPSGSVESFTKLKPASQSDTTITYGLYENVKPFTFDKMTIHYENNSPFLSVTKLARTIEVSHWGVVSIEEDIDVRHTGANLKGPFSRYEYQRDMSGASSIKSFKTVLPASASDVYYRDEIGNISTSHLRVLEDSVEVELRPRFPLFGGWKTHYLLGYYVPTYEYLFNTDENYMLTLRFIDHIFDDCVVEDATVRVILPEGCRDIEVKLPFPARRDPDELHYTYLDTMGRPVIVLQKSNLVEQHIQDFEVHYKFQKVLMLQEPLLVVVALYLLFLLVIIYVRLDFTITQDLQKESKLRVTGIVDRIRKYHQRRTEIYSQYDTSLNKFKSNKDSGPYQTSIKKLNAEYKAETQGITELLAKLKHEGVEVAENVSELQKLDKQLKDQFQQHMTIVDKLIANKMSKQQFVENEGTINKKKEELAEKMVQLVSSL